MKLKVPAVCLEGVDGCGKSSIASELSRLIIKKSKGSIVPITVQDPGAAPLSQELRKLLMREKVSFNLGSLLFTAARCATVEMLMGKYPPYQQYNLFFIFDRWLLSTYVYQAQGDLRKNALVSELSKNHKTDTGCPFTPVADMQYLFIDTPPHICFERRKAKAESKGDVFDSGCIDEYNKRYSLYLSYISQTSFTHLGYAKQKPLPVQPMGSATDIAEDILTMVGG